MKKIRLMAIIPNRNDATSLYRAIGPLSLMSRTSEYLLEICEPSLINWSMIATMCDVLFMQRPFKDDDLTTARIAKNQGKPIWVDYDDDLFSVPMSNPSYRYYGDDRIKKNIATLISMANVTTVSTEQLKKALQIPGVGSLYKQCKVVPNALPHHIIGPMPELPTKRNKLVMWRGSATHMEDIEDYLPEIVSMVMRHVDHTFHFQGDVPWRLKKALIGSKNVVFAPPVDPIEYFHLIAKLQPKVTFVPLHDDAFNRAKSNIAGLESLWCGAVPIAPNYQQWTDVTDYVYTSTNKDKMCTHMEKLLAMSDAQINEIVADKRLALTTMYNLDRSNALRFDILNELATANWFIKR